MHFIDVLFYEYKKYISRGVTHEKKYQIFISSTYIDLHKERDKVRDTILSMYHFPVGMELFGAANEEQWEIIKDTIDTSDYYVLIIGHRYGSIITKGPDKGISYTEKEFRYAKDIGIPILAFFIDESVPVKPENIDIKSQKALDTFKNAVKDGHTITYWKSSDELAKKVTEALYKQMERTPRNGWIRSNTSNTNDDATSNIIAKSDNDPTGFNLRFNGQEESFESFSKNLPHGRIILGLYLKNANPISIPLKQLYTMGLYFGNPRGIKPVLSSFLLAFEREEMDIIIVRRRTDSMFFAKQPGELLASRKHEPTIFDSTAKDIELLNSLLQDEIKKRNIYRDEYCQANGIPATDQRRALKASAHIRQHTKPFMILFENLFDIINSGVRVDILESLKIIFMRAKGYNFYLLGATYPEDYDSLCNHSLISAFVKDQFLLLFGGKYNKQTYTFLPSEIGNITKTDPSYDRYYMKYRDEYYRMIIPCGEIQIQEEDPDDASII